MVETIAEELRIAGYPNIIINAVAPGAVKTGMTDEILKAGKKAGGKALREAVEVIKNGGTPAREIIDLVDFLIDLKRNKGITGRLIHVKEDYDKLIRKYGRKVPEDTGKIRRIPIK
jgi:NAD(P)-dependent dehydrogenase (short-subunit alcohol dehydrogenase family)